MRPSRYSPTRHFRDLARGDLCYQIDNDGKPVWAIVQQVVDIWVGGACPVRTGLFKTLSCYSDGTPMILFGMWFRRSSGVEYGNHEFKPPIDRRPLRLYLDLPAGIFAASRPKVAA